MGGMKTSESNENVVRQRKQKDAKEAEN